MADEHPDADAGDVVFVLKQQEHADFKRKGADLFIERKISLVEALCGFTMELTHLDGRKLLIKTQPGEIVKPMSQGFDPLAKEEAKTEWEVIEDADCPSVENVAQVGALLQVLGAAPTAPSEADTTDIDTLKKACETQLKRKGIDVGCFVVDGQRAVARRGLRSLARRLLQTVQPGGSHDGEEDTARKHDARELREEFTHKYIYIVIVIYISYNFYYNYFIKLMAFL